MKKRTIIPNILFKNKLDYSIKKEENLESLISHDANKYTLNKSISIIIPCYGHAKYITECIDSCLNQTAYAKEIIVLLMDHQSILLKSKLEKKSSIIKCIISERVDLARARNICVEKTESDYFIPLDADDKLPTNFVEEVSKIDADVVYVGAKYFGSISGCWPDPINEEVDWTKLTTFRRNSLVCTSLIKKEAFLKSGKYNEELWAYEDMDLWVKMHKKNFVFKKCFNTFLEYRKHNNIKSLLSIANSSNENKISLKKIIMKSEFYKKTPKIIHWAWLGDKLIPKHIIKTWNEHLSQDWKIILWNEKNFDISSCEFIKKAYDLKKYGICVDYIRAKVLHEYGGVWLDADCVLNNDISPFLQYDFFASWENENFINIGLIGCSPKLEVIKKILEYYSNLKVSEDTIKSHYEFVKKIGTGPIVLTNELLKLRNIRNGGHTENFKYDNKEYLIETPDVFALDDSKNGRINYAVHLFDGSWTEKKEEWSVVVRNSYEAWKIKNKIK